MTFFTYTLRSASFRSVMSILLACTLISCNQTEKSSENNLLCSFEDEALNKKTGRSCILKMDVSLTPEYANDNVLQNVPYNGRIALYNIESGNEEQLGTDFYVTDLVATDDATLAFQIVYADAKGRKVEVPDCRLIHQEGNVANLYFGRSWPFSSEYTATISEDHIFSSDEQDRWYGFSFEQPYTADRYMNNLYSEYKWGFAAVFLLALIFLILNAAYKNALALVGTTAICVISVTHSWMIAFPIVIPFFVALIIMLIPYINRYTIYIYFIGAVINLIYAIGGLWNEYGFFLFLWKLAYISLCTCYAGAFGYLVFAGHCTHCGRFLLKNCYRRKEYFAAEKVLSIPLNSEGVMADNPQPLIDSYEEKHNDKACYWCTKD